jgi:hypothetical protein
MGWGDTLRVAVPSVLAVTLTCPAGAATITVHEPDSHGRVFVDLVGKIEDGDAETFWAKTAKLFPANFAGPKIIVTLVSPGGKTNPAMRIGELIRRSAMSTFVPGGRDCTSACALIWVAGTSRLVGNAPHIGFHAVYNRTTRQETGVGNALVGAYLRDLGLSHKAIAFMTRKGVASLEWLTPEAARDLGVSWAALHPPRTIHIPPQPKLKYRVQPPPQIAAAWAKAIRSAAPRSAPQLLPSVAGLIVPQPAQPAAVPNVDSGFKPTLPAVAQRVVLYEEDPSEPAGKRFIGAATWRAETVTPENKQAPDLAVRCDVEIPERRLTMIMMIRRNRDQALPASHTVEIKFSVPQDFPFGGIKNVPGILMKQAEATRGVPLSGLAVKVTSDFFLLGLSAVEAEARRNLELLKERSWFDIPVAYNNGRRAIIAVEKGNPGERAFAEAFRAWEQ